MTDTAAAAAKVARTHPQSGILNRPPEHALVAAFRLGATDPTTTRAALERLREVERAELRSNLDDQGPTTDKTAPSPETGELGFDDGYDRAHLTITTGLGSGVFDKLGTAADHRPQDLIDIPWPQLGDAPAQPDQGDFVLQVCSDDAYVCEHVVRRVEEELAGDVSLVWTQIGAQRYTTRQGRTSRREGRAVNGFIDGTANLDPRHDEADQRLVFVDPDDKTYPPLPVAEEPGYGGAPGTAFPPDLRQPPTFEPAWLAGASYMVVRSSTVDIGVWDKVPLGEQEQTIGRFKYSGAFLDLEDDPRRVDDPPAFEADQTDLRVALSSHARKTNPRRAEDLDRRIFRRGYPLIAASPTGFQRGLLFIAFARSISTQYEFIVRAWMRNPNFPNAGSGPDLLLRFENHVLCGGYYVVPPLTNRNQPWSWALPPA